MPRKRLALLLIAAAAAYVLAFTVFGAPATRPHSTPAPNAQAEHEPAQPRMPRTSARLIAAGPLAARGARPSIFDPEPLAPASAAEPPAVPVTAYVHAFERALEREQPDARWERQVSAALGAALASAELAGTRVARRRCGATLCRVDLVYASLDARMRAEEALPQHAPFDTDSVIHAEREGSREVAVYFARRGQPLPEPEPSVLASAPPP
jgi:hypothetical protein